MRVTSSFASSSSSHNCSIGRQIEPEDFMVSNVLIDCWSVSLLVFANDFLKAFCNCTNYTSLGFYFHFSCRRLTKWRDSFYKCWCYSIIINSTLILKTAFYLDRPVERKKERLNLILSNLWIINWWALSRDWLMTTAFQIASYQNLFTTIVVFIEILFRIIV